MAGSVEMVLSESVVLLQFILPRSNNLIGRAPRFKLHDPAGASESTHALHPEKVAPLLLIDMPTERVQNVHACLGRTYGDVAIDWTDVSTTDVMLLSEEYNDVHVIALMHEVAAPAPAMSTNGWSVRKNLMSRDEALVSRGPVYAIRND